VLSSVRTANRRRASVGQIILAVMLLLALLASVAPFSSLASHRCQMACCIGKAPHAEGSCSVAFMSEEKEEAAEDQGAEHDAHQHAHHSAAQPSSGKKSSPITSVAAQVVTTPCSPECAAAASALTRSPRPRETAAMSVAGRPRPPSVALYKKDFSRTLLPSGERRDSIRPRAPPISSINLSA
jgi:hypothetical protein